MLLVALGAGASYDAVGHRDAVQNVFFDPYKFPLANELFSSRKFFTEILANFPHAQSLAPELFSRPTGVGLEDLLVDFKREQQEGNAYRAIQLAEIQFYIRQVIMKCEFEYCAKSNAATHHMSLVDQILQFNRRAENTVFVTFNYDRLIESAFERRGRKIERLEDYIESNHSPIVKLHGSTDWLRPLTPCDVDTTHWPDQPSETFTAEHISQFEAGEIQHAARRPKSYAYLPAISIPTREKTYECPSSHVDKLESILPGISAVITIGWQGGEATFKTMIRNHVQHHPPILCIMGPQRKNNDVEEDRAFGTAMTNIRNMFINNPNITFQRIGFGDAVTSTRTIRQFLIDHSSRFQQST